MQHFSIGTTPAPRHVRLLVGVAVLSVAAIAAVSAFAAGGNAVVKVGPSNLGRVLVDAHGKTLYVWAHDKTSKSTCNGACAQYWPPLVTKGRPQAIAGANSKLLGTSRRGDGRMQVTYAGHPLYSFVQDTKAGQTNGESLTDFGGRWDPVSAAGKAVRKGASGASTSGGGGAPVGGPTHPHRGGAPPVPARPHLAFAVARERALDAFQLAHMQATTGRGRSARPRCGRG